jgi:hypothetical protein
VSKKVFHKKELFTLLETNEISTPFLNLFYFPSINFILNNYRLKKLKNKWKQLILLVSSAQILFVMVINRTQKGPPEDSPFAIN